MGVFFFKCFIYITFHKTKAFTKVALGALFLFPAALSVEVNISPRWAHTLCKMCKNVSVREPRRWWRPKLIRRTQTDVLTESPGEEPLHCKALLLKSGFITWQGNTRHVNEWKHTQCVTRERGSFWNCGGRELPLTSIAKINPAGPAAAFILTCVPREISASKNTGQHRVTVARYTRRCTSSETGTTGTGRVDQMMKI